MVVVVWISDLYKIGHCLDVTLGGDDPINIHERTFIYISAYA